MEMSFDDFLLAFSCIGTLTFGGLTITGDSNRVLTDWANCGESTNRQQQS